MQGRQLTLLNLICFSLTPLWRRFRAVYLRYTRTFTPPPAPKPDSPIAETRAAYVETVEACARLAFFTFIAIVAISKPTGWTPNFSFIGLPETIPLPILPLALFCFLLFWTFYGHTIGAAAEMAARLIPVQILARLLADLVSRFLPLRRQVRLPVLGRARAAHTVDPAVDLPGSGVPFLLFATTCSLRIP